MNDHAVEVLPYAEVERRYPDEWVLVEVVERHNDYRKERVRLIAHSSERSDLNEPYWRTRAAAPGALLGQVYTGDIVSKDEDVVIVL